jgi:hypothetical protein
MTSDKILSATEAARRLDITKPQLRRLTEAGRITVEYATVCRDERLPLYHADDVSNLALELCDLPSYVRDDLADRPKPIRELLFATPAASAITEWSMDVEGKRVTLRIE